MQNQQFSELIDMLDSRLREPGAFREKGHSPTRRTVGGNQRHKSQPQVQQLPDLPQQKGSRLEQSTAGMPALSVDRSASLPPKAAGDTRHKPKQAGFMRPTESRQRSSNWRLNENSSLKGARSHSHVLAYGRNGSQDNLAASSDRRLRAQPTLQRIPSHSRPELPRETSGRLHLEASKSQPTLERIPSESRPDLPREKSGKLHLEVSRSQPALERIPTDSRPELPRDTSGKRHLEVSRSHPTLERIHMDGRLELPMEPSFKPLRVEGSRSQPTLQRISSDERPELPMEADSAESFAQLSRQQPTIERITTNDRHAVPRDMSADLILEDFGTTQPALRPQPPLPVNVSWFSAAGSSPPQSSSWAVHSQLEAHSEASASSNRRPSKSKPAGFMRPTESRQRFSNWMLDESSSLKGMRRQQPAPRALHRGTSGGLQEELAGSRRPVSRSKAVRSQPMLHRNYSERVPALHREASSEIIVEEMSPTQPANRAKLLPLDASELSPNSAAWLQSQGQAAEEGSRRAQSPGASPKSPFHVGWQADMLGHHSGLRHFGEQPLGQISESPTVGTAAVGSWLSASAGLTPAVATSPVAHRPPSRSASRSASRSGSRPASRSASRSPVHAGSGKQAKQRNSGSWLSTDVSSPSGSRFPSPVVASTKSSGHRELGASCLFTGSTPPQPTPRRLAFDSSRLEAAAAGGNSRDLMVEDLSPTQQPAQLPQEDAFALSSKTPLSSTGFVAAGGRFSPTAASSLQVVREEDCRPGAERRGLRHQRSFSAAFVSDVAESSDEREGEVDEQDATQYSGAAFIHAPSIGTWLCKPSGLQRRRLLFASWQGDVAEALAGDHIYGPYAGEPHIHAPSIGTWLSRHSGRPAASLAGEQAAGAATDDAAATQPVLRRQQSLFPGWQGAAPDGEQHRHGGQYNGEGHIHAPSIGTWLSKPAGIAGAAEDASSPPGPLALHFAARAGDVEEAKRLLARGADPNAADKRGVTPLHLAAEAGHSEVSECLLNAGADPNAKTYALGGAAAQGITPLHAAACGGHGPVVQLLLRSGAWADVARADGVLPLHFAAQGGHVEAARCLLGDSRGKGMADAPAAGAGGFTPLHDAAAEGHAEVVSLLLDAGVSPCPVAHDDATPLHAAARQGHGGVVARLLAAGAAPDATSDGGFTPLHDAAYGGHAPVVLQLLAAGASLEVKSAQGATALKLACAANSNSVVNAILAAKKAANAASKSPKKSQSEEADGASVMMPHFSQLMATTNQKGGSHMKVLRGLRQARSKRRQAGATRPEQVCHTNASAVEGAVGVA
eukprot:TRINITY_DN80121_c0_g1_i1.p1 TRINITY_DN80121_c0_g1~~TRINITY_DN80121_c0_g1_i1.p1  ORF type:complete len:1299 (+),score=271.80 TRINITY_DN80121_c0_g1_i1:141-4037(+)